MNPEYKRTSGASEQLISFHGHRRVWAKQAHGPYHLDLCKEIKIEKSTKHIKHKKTIPVTGREGP
jgi:hypothetical protein